MTEQDRLAQQRKLIASLAATLGGESEIHETHISWVLVAGGHAYKFKKAVRFDFLDFSTLKSRRFYCDEELRLNARMAPDIYLDVVAVTGSPGQPVLEGTGEAIEYAVKMRAFDQQSLWHHRLDLGVLSGWEIDALADHIAGFHTQAAIAPEGSGWCTPEALRLIADETLATIARLLQIPHQKRDAMALRAWEESQHDELRCVFAARKTSGHIRECHGDLHSGNILTLGHRVEAFDCIEFNESLRRIDVMNDIAFTCMDLRFRQQSGLASRLLNRYLERTGDYAGLAVFRYYETHRALIRCKVALLRAAQCAPGSGEAAAATRQAGDYLAFAMRRSEPSRPAVIITHGFSGCGKSTIARQLVETLDAVQLRSDVERKRMHGIAAETKAGAELYATDVTRRTYERLRELAMQAVRAGWKVIIDATFLRAGHRQMFHEMAAALGVPFLILDVIASEAVMRARIRFRQQSEHDVSDAGVDILEHQLANHDPFTIDELRYVVTVDSESGAGLGAASRKLTST